MKKLFLQLMALAITACTFTACEDVPEPYNNPYANGIKSSGTQDDEPAPDPAGTGTAANPYNVAKALQVCAEVGEGGTATDVYAKGYVLEISELSTSYGNATFILSDTKGGANKLTVYRAVGPGKQKITDEKLIKEGDLVVICGKLVNFKGNTPEFTQGCYIVSINEEGGETPADETIGTKEAPVNVARALTDIDKLEEGGTTKEYYYIKGTIKTIKTAADKIAQYKNIDYIITDDGSNELTVFRGKNIDNTDFTEAGQINVGDVVVVYGQLTKYKNANTGAIVPEVAQGNYIVSKSSGGDTPTPSGDAKGTGTAADPYNVVAALAKCAEVGETGTSTDVYTKGFITAIKNIDTGQYGNAEFTISDDKDASNKLTVYRALSLGNKKFTSADEIKVGDEVIICGKLVNFKGNTPEYTQGCYLYSLNGKTEGGDTPNPPTPSGDTGTKENPLTASQAYDAVAAMEAGVTSEADYYVKGKIASIKYEYSAQYGTATFNITDGSKEFIAYSCYYFDNKPWAEGNTQIAVNDEVIVCGKVVNYGGNTPEFASKKSWLVSLNGKTSDEGGNNQGGGGNNGGGETATSLVNGNFESWTGDQPTGWKSASTASSATLAQSTDAHGGSYAVLVKGDESKNVRLATQELALAAGTYTFSFWVKPTTEDAMQVRPGYVPVTDGKAGSYSYGDYATLSAGWQQVSYEFTLSADATVCLVVMNPKKSSYSSAKDVLIDDATLTKK